MQPLPPSSCGSLKDPTFDTYLKSEVSSAVKSVDKELARLQTFVLDAVSPLSVLLEATNSDSLWKTSKRLLQQP